MNQQQYGGEPRRADRREPDVLLRERRAAQARSDRARHDPRRRTSPPSTRGWPRSAIQGPPIATGIYPNPVDIDERPRRRSITRSTAAISSAFATACTTSRPSNSRGAGGLNAPSASAGLDNIDQTVAVSNTLTLSPRTVNETRAQFAYSDLKAPPTDPDRARGQHRRRRLVRHALGQSDAAREQDVSGRQQPVASGGRARAAGGRRLPLQRRHDHLSALGSRQLHVLVAGELPGRHLQQRRLHPDVRRDRRCRRRIRTSASTRRTSGRSAPS